MPIFSKYSAGQFCWIDLMARDAEVAQEFFCGLFGWKAEVQDTEGGPPYVIFTRDGHNICGFGQMNDEMKQAGMPSIWCSYICVDDVDQCIEKATSLGAQVVMPAIDVMTSGRMAILHDPEGAGFALWQPQTHCGAQLANEPNSWCWNELVSRDLSGARKFYNELFGWNIEQEENSEIEYWNICNQDRLNGGMTAMPDGIANEVPAYWAVYFSVADLTGSLNELNALGGNVLHGPFAVAVGDIAVVAEPGGGVFYLIQMSVPPDDAPES